MTKPRLEGLVHRWRLVNTSSNRFKIMNTEGIRVIKTVPTYNAKWMSSIGIVCSISSFFTFMVKSPSSSWAAPNTGVRIALTIRTVLEQLPEPVAVTLGEYTGGYSDDKEPIGRSSKVKLLNHPARNHQIISFEKPIPQTASSTCRSPHAQNHLVVLRILIEVIRHGCCRGSKSDGTILIGQDRHTTSR